MMRTGSRALVALAVVAAACGGEPQAGAPPQESAVQSQPPSCELPSIPADVSLALSPRGGWESLREAMGEPASTEASGGTRTVYLWELEGGMTLDASRENGSNTIWQVSLIGPLPRCALESAPTIFGYDSIEPSWSNSGGGTSARRWQYSTGAEVAVFIRPAGQTTMLVATRDDAPF